MTIQNLNKSSEKLLDKNISNINNVTNSEILNYNDSSFIYVDNFLICITKQVRKNIEAAKVEFDTFLRRDEPTKIIREPHKTDTSSEISTEIKFSTSQENFIPSQDSAEITNCDITEIPDEKTSTVRPSEENERSIFTYAEPTITNEPSLAMNVHEISDVPINYNTKHAKRMTQIPVNLREALVKNDQN